MNSIINYKWFCVGLIVWIAGANMAQAATFLALRVSTPLIVSASAGIRFGDEAEEGFQPVAEVEDSAWASRRYSYRHGLNLLTFPVINRFWVLNFR